MTDVRRVGERSERSGEAFIERLGLLRWVDPETMLEIPRPAPGKPEGGDPGGET